MPLITLDLENFKLFGFKKIWSFTKDIELDDIKYADYISANAISPQYIFHTGVFIFEAMNCLIIAFIIL
jgi:large-conductance mechanosensitive channel